MYSHSSPSSLFSPQLVFWRKPCNHLGITKMSWEGLSQCILVLILLASTWKGFQTWMCDSQMVLGSSDFKPFAVYTYRENNSRGHVLQSNLSPHCEASVAQGGYRRLLIAATCCECCQTPAESFETYAKWFLDWHLASFGFVCWTQAIRVDLPSSKQCGCAFGGQLLFLMCFRKQKLCSTSEMPTGPHWLLWNKVGGQH